MTVATVPLVLDCFDGSQAPTAIGRALLVPSALLTDPTDHVTQLPSPVPVDFTPDTPTPTVSLVPTDNANFLPSGWAWSIVFSGMSNPPLPFSFDLPYNGGATTYLSEVTQVEAGVSFAAYLLLSGGQLTGALDPAVVSLTDASVVAVSALLGNDFELTMTAAVGGSRQIAMPTGLTDGQKILFDFTQPPSGGPCAVTWAAGYSFGTAGQPSLSTGAGRNDLLAFRYKSAKSACQFLGPASGFA